MRKIRHKMQILACWLGFHQYFIKTQVPGRFLPMTHNGSVIKNLPEKLFFYSHLREKGKLSGRAYRQLTTENEWDYKFLDSGF